MKNSAASGSVYGLGFIGAVIYYILHAPTFWWGIVGIIKAVFWPAFLIYRVFVLLHM